MLKFLHEGDHNPVQFAYVQGTAPLLPKSVQFVQKQDAGGRLGEVKKLAEMDSGLAKVGTDDGVKAHNIGRNLKLLPDSTSRDALSAAWGAVKEQLGTRGDSSLPKAFSVLPFEYHTLKVLPGRGSQHHIL